MENMEKLCWAMCCEMVCAIPSSVEKIRGNVFAFVLAADAFSIANFIRNEFASRKFLLFGCNEER